MTDSEDEGSLDDECPINEEWLEDVLSCYHRQRYATDQQLCVKVGDFAVRPGCASNESVLSDIVAVTVDYKLLLAVDRGREAEETSHTLALVVKLLPSDPFSRVFVTEAQFDLREISFYTKVVPDLEALDPDQALPIPRCYFARYAPATDVSAPESLLVLDNLKAAGYKGQPFSLGLTLAQARAALASVARLHALTLVLKLRDPDARPLSERYPFLFAAERASESYQELVERGMPLPGMEAVARALARLRPLTKDLMTELLAPSGSLALITHTDFWCNNLLFKDQEGDGELQCAVLDWQMATYSRPTNDVALLLLSSLPTQLRRDNETDLVDTYWRTFTSTTARLGVDVEVEHGYDRRQLDADLQRSKLLAILLCIGSVEVAIGDPLTEQRLVDVLTDLHQDGALDIPAAEAVETPCEPEPDA
ncbi:EcKinase 11 [Frankliniella occidentalis]|nr:EcKinase 11 [Frankliniella occidentalis]